MSQYKVKVVSFEHIQELPGSWEKNDLVNLLTAMDYDNPAEISDAELKEMCMMSLTDYEPDEAAKVVLNYTIDGRLTDGQIENLSHEILTEKLWEEYPELPLHPDLFRSTQLLYDAFNGKFPRAEAVRFTVEIEGDVEIFNENPEAPILRILAAGMSDRSLIHRLFSDQIEGKQFKEAKDILWQLNVVSKTETTVTYDIVSSSYWLDDLKYADSFEAEAHADLVTDEDGD